MSGNTSNQTAGNSTDTPEVGTFRRILPQIIATSAKNCLLFSLGLAIVTPVIVIPALSKHTRASGTETITITAIQATWLGSVEYICQPIGSFFSGMLTEPLGRKRSMILVNLPHIIGFILLSFATSLEMVFVAIVLLGLGNGFMEAPVFTYVGEICEPAVRGILAALGGITVWFGITALFFLGTQVVWRKAALICFFWPIFTCIVLMFVPETPMWLLARKRSTDAMKSLQWLRGWVAPNAVQKEYNELTRYTDISNMCLECQTSGVNKCEHPPPTLLERLKDLLHSHTLKPFALLMVFFLITQFCGSLGMRPYIMQIFKAYRIKIDPAQAVFYLGLVGISSNISCLVLVHILGKRRLYLISVFGTLSCLFGLGIYAHKYLPADLNSFDIPPHEYAEKSHTPMFLFLFLNFFTTLGITSIPWILLSELFPFKSRGFSTGITAALNYVMTFTTIKTYYSLELCFGLYGIAFFYACMNVLAFVFLLFMLPETENRTLEDIEAHFSNPTHKFTNITIVDTGKRREKHAI